MKLIPPFSISIIFQTPLVFFHCLESSFCVLFYFIYLFFTLRFRSFPTFLFLPSGKKSNMPTSFPWFFSLLLLLFSPLSSFPPPFCLCLSAFIHSTYTPIHKLFNKSLSAIYVIEIVLISRDIMGKREQVCVAFKGTLKKKFNEILTQIYNCKLWALTNVQNAMESMSEQPYLLRVQEGMKEDISEKDTF